jgi:hypothetical protein
MIRMLDHTADVEFEVEEAPTTTVTLPYAPDVPLVSSRADAAKEALNSGLLTLRDLSDPA